MAADLQGMKIGILVSNQGIEESELIQPRQALEEAGAETDLIAPQEGEVLTFNHLDKAEYYPVDATFDEIEATDYDGYLIPGGVANADALRINPHAQAIVQQADEAGKPLAVICHGPWLLISAGLVDGRTVTAYRTVADDIINAGGEFTDKAVVVDENWVSSRQPDDIPQFNAAMIKLFSQIFHAGGLPV